MDVFSKEKRSWVMSKIQGKDTKPEIKVRSLLHSLGYRFRLYDKKLFGKPDIILPKYHHIIFVHGCFWHRHEGCKYAYNPKSRTEFWEKKFSQNLIRDIEVRERLEVEGWKVSIIWECETQNHEGLLNKIENIMNI